MSKKDNQRTRLTKLLLKNSLITLLHKKPIYQISVSELCTEAELNRSTFYRYYGNVQDILQEIEDETLQKGTQCIQEIETAGVDRGEKPLYQLLCDVKKNQEVYRVLLNNSVNGIFPTKMLEGTASFFKERIQAAGKEGALSDYVCDYLISGSISVIEHWLFGEMKETPAEISKLIYSMSVSLLEHMGLLPS